MNCKIEYTDDYTHNQVRLQSFTLESENKILENTNFGFSLQNLNPHQRNRLTDFQMVPVLITSTEVIRNFTR